jgi:hypothetical protein
MSIRKTALYRTASPPPETNTIPATVRFRHNKRQGIIEPLSANEKLICALRKVLTEMSDQDGRCRYYIADNQVKLTQRPVASEGRAGEPQTHRAAGRCKVRVCHPEGHTSSMQIQFAITFRDSEDEYGLPDVEYIEPTTVDLISKIAAAS